MTAIEIECEVYGFGEKDRYADGLERIELYVNEEYVGSIGQMPKMGERRHITLSTSTGDYDGGIRSYDGRWPYVCPNLISKRDGKRISLARILKDNGIDPHDRVRIGVSDGTWTLLGLI